ncbi:ATP-binding protein [Amycolatopsis sp. OK19-0408]|uniref:ATP-binding protein n=1 Tax=Amycolatopsis iheyensis TaxID=2945988 RepID=A0A9X2NL79_9PSEU|nr:ATP-binding protein [Amycolatopsis iheyensis]MCR6490769.1 ATP-binding protein [Amycolatopsis iheyensis]
MDPPQLATYDYCLDAEAAPDLAAMRRWTRHVLDSAPTELVEDAVLLATELAANAMDHAHGIRAFRIRYRDRASSVLLEIDDGRPDLELHLGATSPGNTRGRGLLLVNTISRRWGVITRGDHDKTVWADVAAT